MRPPLRVVVERTAKVSGAGDVDDVLTLAWTNDGDVPVSLGGVLTFMYRDSPTTFVAARDHGGTWEPVWHDRLATDERLVVEPHGPFEPGSRVIGVRTVRKGLTTVRDDRIVFRDPLYGMPLTKDVSSCHYRSAVLFSASRYRTVAAPLAREATSCDALFDFGSAPREKLEYLVMEAEWKQTALAGTPLALDEAISDVRWAIALAAVGDCGDISKARSICRDLGMAVPDDEHLLSLPFWERVGLLGTVQSTIEAERAAWFAAGPAPVRALGGIVGHVERIGNEVERLLGKSATLPLNATDALTELLHYQVTQRRSPSKWASPLKEGQFQERLNEFLVGRGGAALREVPVGRGRADFLLGDTPLELKVEDLDPTDPFASTRPHLSQAAEYASARGVQLAVLMILDRHAFDGSSSCLPRPEEHVRVEVVTSLPGVAGPSEIAVASIVVTVFPPRPSDLKG